MDSTFDTASNTPSSAYSSSVDVSPQMTLTMFLYHTVRGMSCVMLCVAWCAIVVCADCWLGMGL